MTRTGDDVLVDDKLDAERRDAAGEADRKRYLKNAARRKRKEIVPSPELLHALDILLGKKGKRP